MFYSEGLLLVISSQLSASCDTLFVFLDAKRQAYHRGFHRQHSFRDVIPRKESKCGIPFQYCRHCPLRYYSQHEKLECRRYLLLLCVEARVRQYVNGRDTRCADLFQLQYVWQGAPTQLLNRTVTSLDCERASYVSVLEMRRTMTQRPFVMGAVQQHHLLCSSLVREDRLIHELIGPSWPNLIPNDLRVEMMFYVRIEALE